MFLIFGSSSFVGKHFCDFLIDRGERFIFVDRTKCRLSPAHLSLSDFLNLDQHACRDLLKLCKGIVYCIGNSNPYAFEEKLHEEISDFVPLLSNVAKKVALFSSNVPFVFLSSAGMVYSRKLIVRSELSPVNPETSYGFTKYLSEETIKFLGQNYNLNYCILRLSNPVGKWHRNPKQGVIGVLNSAFKNRQSFTLIGDGNQERDFIDCDDVSNAILKAIHYIMCDKNPLRIFNIARGESYSINRIIKELSIIYDYEIDVIKSDKPFNHPDSYIVDITRAVDNLDWSPSSSLSDILRKIV